MKSKFNFKRVDFQNLEHYARDMILQELAEAEESVRICDYCERKKPHLSMERRIIAMQIRKSFEDTRNEWRRIASDYDDILRILKKVDDGIVEDGRRIEYEAAEKMKEIIMRVKKCQEESDRSGNQAIKKYVEYVLDQEDQLESSNGFIRL